MPVTPIETSLSSAEDWIASPYLDRFVARVVLHRGISMDDVADLAQETRIALWEAGSDTPVSAALVARIVSNKATDFLRGLIRRRAKDRTATPAAPAPQRDAELRHLLNVQVAALPERLHEFYELRYEQGFSEREIARAWGLSRSSVRWLDRCCRRTLGTIQPPQRSAGRSSRSIKSSRRAI